MGEAEDRQRAANEEALRALGIDTESLTPEASRARLNAENEVQVARESRMYEAWRDAPSVTAPYPQNEVELNIMPPGRLPGGFQVSATNTVRFGNIDGTITGGLASITVVNGDTGVPTSSNLGVGFRLTARIRVPGE
ncbi:MAG: hypothetical protein J0M34_01725 [Alphaproteobacteria bacterium]|nr:hypothetical protein [Alphaproteobacteria bacterium]